MPDINSVSKNKIKEIVKLHQKKYRDENGLFIAEGFNALEEILKESVEIVEIFVLKDYDISNINHSVTVIDEDTMKKISTTASACEVLTIAKKRNFKTDDLKNKKKLILLDSINDPGNLGTIIRSAAAFGIDSIILFNNCVDLYSSKVIRSSAGNFFKTPIVSITNIEELSSFLQDYTKIATALSKENNIEIKELKNIDKYVIMFGSEAHGLSKELIKLADKNIKIDMKNNVESLNLAVTASIVLYELAK